MDLASRLLLLLEVTELGSFAKVSEHRNVNRSVISKQVSKLEDELGVRLLNRTTRSLSLTAAGSEMVCQAQTRVTCSMIQEEPLKIIIHSRAVNLKFLVQHFSAGSMCSRQYWNSSVNFLMLKLNYY